VVEDPTSQKMRSCKLGAGSVYVSYPLAAVHALVNATYEVAPAYAVAGARITLATHMADVVQTEILAVRIAAALVPLAPIHAPIDPAPGSRAAVGVDVTGLTLITVTIAIAAAVTNANTIAVSVANAIAVAIAVAITRGALVRAGGTVGPGSGAAPRASGGRRTPCVGYQGSVEGRRRACDG